MDKSLTIIMPVYMEAENIRDSVANTKIALAEAKIGGYEILIIDCKRQDGTDDGTPAIADELARQDSRIRVFHNSYINLGEKYWIGVDNARYPYVTLVPGDNEIPPKSIQEPMMHIGEADIITTYPANMKVRPLMRRVVSYTFTGIVNLISGLNLKYYNGSCIHKTELVRTIKLRNHSFAYMAEILIQLLKQGHSYKEVPTTLQPRGGGKPAAFKKDNVISVGKTLVSLFFKYRLGI